MKKAKIIKIIFCISVVLTLPFSTKEKTNSTVVKDVSNHNYYSDLAELQLVLCQRVKEFSLNKIYDLKAYNISFTSAPVSEIENLSLKFQKVNQFKDEFSFNFYDGDSYSNRIEGITCFRGNNMRDASSYGLAEVNDEKLEIVWQNSIGSIDKWTGVGWNGQASVVKWQGNIIENMNIYDNKKKQSLTEVVYAALDGKVHFYDLETGEKTRDEINIGAPIKGSVTIDPRGYPLLYVGQGINKNNNKTVAFAYRIYSLLDGKKLFEIKGNDNFAKRTWGAFDSTSLVDGDKDVLVVCGENGLVYSVKLNTKYTGDSISIDPEVNKYRYTSTISTKRGIENSIAMYGDYGFFADNDGLLQCLNLKEMIPMWAMDVKDDTDSTIVLEREEDILNLYTSCEVDHQGNKGYCYIRKINASNGELRWEKKYKCTYFDGVNGGALATPIVGKNDINDLVIFNVARTPSVNKGILVALNKKNGEVEWEIEQENYCWSSPAAVYDSDGKSYIIQCDSTGKTFLIEGISGRILDTINLGSNIEGSPVGFNNYFTVGTRGSKIYCFKIK